MKLFKILGIAVLAIFAIFVALALAAMVFFDPNDFRGQISGAVKTETGRELTIAGDIKLRFFPWLGVKINQVTLGNAEGFGPQPFAEIGQAEVSVRLLPLILDQEVRAGTVSLEGLRLNLAKDANGKDNWSDIGKSEEEKEKPAVEVQVEAEAPVFDISGLDIKDAALSYVDAQARKSYKLENFNFKTGKLKPGEPVDIDLSVLLNSTDPKFTADVKGGGTLNADFKAKHYAFNKLKLEVAASGDPVPGGRQNVILTGDIDFDQAKGLARLGGLKLEAAGITVTSEIEGKGLEGEKPTFAGPINIAVFSPRTVLKNLQIEIPEPSDPKALTEASLSARLAATSKSANLNDLRIKLDQTTAEGKLAIDDFATMAIEFALKVDAFDADRYMAKEVVDAGKPAAPQDKSDVNAIEIPVKALDALNANGTLDIATLKLKGLQMSGVTVKLTAPKGKTKTTDLTAKLYSGGIQSRVAVTPGANPNYTINTLLAGIDAGPLLKDFMGKDYVTGGGNFQFHATSSGKTVGDARKALNGDIAFTFTNGAVKGFNIAQIIRQAQALLRKEAYDAKAAPAQTDFAELAGKGKIVNGVLTTEFLTAKNPALRFEGEGSVDLVKEQIDYLAKPTVVETSKGQGGAELAELKGFTIPIKVFGSFSDPKYKVDLESMLKDKAKEKLNEEYKKQEDKLKGKLQDKLGEFLRKQQPQQPAAPQQPAPAPAPQQ
jgi:AsmA protein